ncbi:DUF502 domain-containing protein [Akkermansiaceae bacterium]|nr:DUF502 domain-containing protein [Akkermansiaceae bacterium]
MSEVPVIDQPDEPSLPFIRRMMKLLLAGMATVIPILATGWIVVMVFKLLHRIGLAIINTILKLLNAVRGVKEPSEVTVEKVKEPSEVAIEKVKESSDAAAQNLLESSDRAWTIEGFPGDAFLWLLIPLALLFLVGLAVTNRPGKRIVGWIDGVVTRIPVFGFIYSSIKQFVDAVRNLGGPKKFKGVAYVEYPSPGCRMIGFITGHFRDPQTQKDTTSVFIPTSPNPMTGFVILIDDEKVFHSDMTLEEAGKMILSAGLVAPESYEELDPIKQDH